MRAGQSPPMGAVQATDRQRRRPHGRRPCPRPGLGAPWMTRIMLQTTGHPPRLSRWP